jgi:hypothetical protein
MASFLFSPIQRDSFPSKSNFVFSQFSFPFWTNELANLEREKNEQSMIPLIHIYKGDFPRTHKAKRQIRLHTHKTDSKRIFIAIQRQILLFNKHRAKPTTTKETHFAVTKYNARHAAKQTDVWNIFYPTPPRLLRGIKARRNKYATSLFCLAASHEISPLLTPILHSNYTTAAVLLSIYTCMQTYTHIMVHPRAGQMIKNNIMTCVPT